nr:MAG TPA: Peptidase [Crassvirales sp.]
MEIVKGNDIKVVWAITKTVDNVNIPEDLSTATNIRFKVWCSGTLISVPDYSVSGNEITFTIKGSVQRTGEYSFEVSYSKGYDARVVYKDAFLVVDLACQANYVKPDDIQVTTLQFYSSISSLYLWQLLDVKKSTTDNSVDKTFDKFYLGYDAKLKQWYGMKIPEETFKLEDMWKALDAENEIIPKSHLDLTGLATQEWVKQQIDNIPTGGGDIDINVVTQLVKDIIGKWFKEDKNSDLYVVNKIVDGAEVGRNFYTYGGITAMGKSDGGGGGTGGASSLGQLTNVGDWADTTPTEDRLFIQKAGATHWSSMRLTDIKVDLSNYYTKSETNSAISKAVVDAVTPVQNLLNNHINNADIHVTLAEKTLWNKIAGYFAEDSNQDIFVTNKSDGTPRGFYSNSFVSALGLNTGGGSGGGMDEDLLWSILGDGDNPDKQIAVSHLTKALSPYSTTSQMNTAIGNAVKDYIPLSQKGRAGGVVPLDNDGLISSMYLPSYVDDVLEYSTFSALPATGESGKIYVTLDTNLTYRWSGTSYVEISKSLALGETADTAYAGNKGKENRDSINRLKNATFWGATYQANGNVYGTFNGTEIYLTNKIETPKIKIGDIFLEYDAERNAIKGVKYNSDGAEEMANFYMTGGITALGISSSGGISFTLQDLADTNISNPQDKQALVYDAASQKWINGQAIGGGDISLNGTVYKPVNGIITLPGLYEKVSGGTASQFLKADGSVDGNLYALAYNNNPNKVLESNVSNSLHVIDRRNTVMLPTTFEDNTISTFFNVQSTPTNNWWSGIAIKGWSGEYGVWMLAGPAAGDNAGNRLYYKDGNHSNWATDWKGLAFLDDIKNLADVYFNGQNIYSDYGHWVVGLVRIGTADIGDKYISGEMIYRRSNGIYGNGSVRFNLIKKYSSTQMYAGVFYTGYGVDPDQDAPRLCTFTYQGVKWGGLCWRSAASLDSIKTIIYDNSSTDTPFYVKYFNSQSSEIQNAEINNSISVLGSDIDVQPVSTNGRFYTSADRIEINNITNGWSYIRYRTNGIFYDVGLSGTTAGMAGAGNFEIRPNGSNNEGVFVRYYQSDYGKLGVVNKSGQQCSISYFNNAPTGDYPLWTVGAGIRNQYSFDWWYHNQGYKATLDSEGKLFVNVRVAGNPYCSLTIGDYDTGLHWQADGIIEFRSNAKQVGYWGYTNGRLFNCYFREPTGNGYAATSMMVNGNGSNLYPGVGFHQPGVDAAVLYYDSSYKVFKFRDINDAGYKGLHIAGIIAHGSINPGISNQDLGTQSLPWRQAYINHIHGSANKLATTYFGEKRPNPQDYFDPQTGLRVAMTGSIKYWNDTLWINGYSGDDVKDMCALHTVRDGTPQMYISTQKSDATSYGTMYLFYTSYNANKSDRPWICSTLNAYGRITTASDIYSQSWVRTVGTTGWYSESYGGGWHMTDSTWLRAYNNKQIYTGSTSADAIHTAGGMNASGRIYGGGIVTAGGGLDVVGVRASTGCSGFNVYGRFYGNGQHGGIEIGASDNVFGIGVHSNDHMYWWWTNAGSVDSSSNKSYVMEYGGGTWQFTGNIGATGGITAMTSSDENLKNRLDYEVDYASKLLLLGKVFDFTYNDKALSRKDKYADRNVHTGLSWQKVRNILPTVCGMDKDGYGYINYISPDLISLIAGATQLNTLGIQSILDRTKSLEERVNILERRNEQLELKIKLIQR